MPLLCPACRSEFDPAATSCGVCLRPRSRQEIFRGMRRLSQEEKAQRRRPFLIAGAVLAAVAAGFGAYAYRQRRPPAVAQVAPSQVEAPKAAESFPSMQESPEPPQYSAQPPGEYQRAAGETRPKGLWTVRGRAYELTTLEAAAGAQLIFTERNRGQVFKTTTKKNGSYKIRLPRAAESGYVVTVRHKNRRADYLDEMEPPYERQSRNRRLEAAQMMSQASVLHVPLLPPEHEEPLVYNLVLLSR